MEEPHRDNIPTLSYASPETPAPIGDPLLLSMQTWRRRTAWGLFACLLGASLGWAGILLSLAFLLLASAMTLAHMTRYAHHNVGKGYAIRHLVLAILLTPVVLAGVFLVTRLVEADIERWHLLEDRPPE